MKKYKVTLVTTNKKVVAYLDINADKLQEYKVEIDKH